MTTTTTVQVQPTIAGPDAPTAEAPKRPEHIPEKFWDNDKGEVRLDDLVKSYTELEKKATKAPQDAPKDQEQQSKETPEGNQQEAQKDAQVQSILEKAGLNVQDFDKEFRETGNLSEASYEKLQKAGFDKDTVDAYIEGKRAIANKYISDVQSVVGGSEKYGEIIAWAAKNLSPEEIDAFNDAVDSRDANKAKLAVHGLKAKYVAAEGSEPNLLGGNSGSSSNIAPYQSWQEVQRDMSDPRYKSGDKAYHKMVEARLAKSKI